MKDDESELVRDLEQSLGRAVGDITRHAEDCIRLVRSFISVGEMRNKMTIIAKDNELSLLATLGHDCSESKSIIMSAVLNIRLLYAPIAVGVHTGESFAAYRDRVVEEVNKARDDLIATIKSDGVKDAALQVIRMNSHIRTAIAMQELQNVDRSKLN